MTEKEERAYEDGSRAAWRRVLAEASRNLGVKDVALASLVAERHDALVALRDLCRRFGDDDWTDDLSLADVIEKHLASYLDEGGA